MVPGGPYCCKFVLVVASPYSAHDTVKCLIGREDWDAADDRSCSQKPIEWITVVPRQTTSHKTNLTG